ncbi:MAG: F0F1 ATP synthase subunit gamma [Ilumatobacteraceae bacterium]
MSDTLESLQRRKDSAADLKTVVRTMKAMAASRITQFEMAVASLQDYYRTITLGLNACFRQTGALDMWVSLRREKSERAGILLVFGTDQGLVGKFNEVVAAKVLKDMNAGGGGGRGRELWTVGERISSLLEDAGHPSRQSFPVPVSINTVAMLVNQILLETDKIGAPLQMLTLYNNAPLQGTAYAPSMTQILPMGEQWLDRIRQEAWPGKVIPQIVGDPSKVLSELLQQYLFVSIFKACSESLASENASRLEAMQRAEKNINEITDELNQAYNRLRQSQIDEELFDVLAGYFKK